MRRRGGRWLGAAVGAVAALLVAAPAQATLTGDINVSLYPKGYNPAAPGGSTAWFSGRYLGDRGAGSSFATVQVRDGAVVARRGDALEVAPHVDVLPGDEFRVLDPLTGAVRLSYRFDGRPALSDSTCAGARTFRGTRTGAAAVDVREVDPYDIEAAPSIAVLDRHLANGRFSGRFDRPLRAGHFVSVTQTISDTADGHDFTYVVSSVTKVPSCRATGAKGATRLTRVAPWGPEAKAARFERGRLRTNVAIDGPGVVSVRYYRADRARGRGPLLGFGQATATTAGRFPVDVLPTRAGLRLLRARDGRATGVYALATVRDRAGRVTRARPVRARLQPPGSVLLAVEPWMARARAADFLRDGLGAMVETDGAGTVQLLARRTGRGRHVVVGRGAVTVDAAQRVRVTVRPTAAGRRLLARAHTLRVAVTGTIRDGAGHVMRSAPAPTAIRR